MYRGSPSCPRRRSARPLSAGASQTSAPAERPPSLPRKRPLYNCAASSPLPSGEDLRRGTLSSAHFSRAILDSASFRQTFGGYEKISYRENAAASCRCEQPNPDSFSQARLARETGSEKRFGILNRARSALNKVPLLKSSPEGRGEEAERRLAF